MKHRSVHSLTFVFIFLLTGLVSAQRADFVIIEHPEQLVIYDRFQQRMTRDAKAGLGTFVPIRILQRKTVLGDQITEALKGRVNGRTVFLPLNEQGEPVNEEQAGVVKYYRNCALIDDTARVQGKITLYHPAAPGRRILSRLQTGQKVWRIFKSRNYVYLRTLGRPDVYGWISAWQQARLLKETRPIPLKPVASLDQTTRERILRRIAAANRSYQAVFEHLNRLTGKMEPTPRWVPENPVSAAQNESQMVFVLQPPELARQLTRSTPILIQDLRGLLIGSGWKLIYSNGIIKIKPGS
ncbi:MAG TPA: hypothetical protein ENJ89_07660 [Caldithrix abyssi]|uniref:Uncharacterized protein n=1 Tax=Caldithrix abyssi TaxID=187145 RepID=A0A7V5UF75_CALAY|nr:hypothetical protein [Caldithrix abyssi]